MKVLKAIGIILFCLFLVTLGLYLGAEYKKQTAERQHIKIQRVGCHQYRINEFNNEVTHLEGCNNLNHLETLK